jgi:hypothetical protein
VTVACQYEPTCTGADQPESPVHAGIGLVEYWVTHQQVRRLHCWTSWDVVSLKVTVALTAILLVAEVTVAVSVTGLLGCGAGLAVTLVTELWTRSSNGLAPVTVSPVEAFWM